MPRCVSRSQFPGSSHPASFDSFERMRIAGDHAHYVVTRTVDGQPYAFFVTFVRDGDGVWRISDM
jgi:hypothetical protein